MKEWDRNSGISRQVMRNIAVSLVVATLAATIFTAWTPATLSPEELAGQLAVAFESQEETTFQEGLSAVPLTGESGIRIGIVAGHTGPHPDTGYLDPGATCNDGLTELEVNQRVADLAVRGLTAAGFEVDLMEEFDDRLIGYRAVALVSIHADSCAPINEFATGYKISAAVDTSVPDKAQRLVACMADRYGRATDLRFHPSSITIDMTEYHTFNEVHSQTPAVIIETGFMYLDREFLTASPDKVANGIVGGILCYVHNEPSSLGSDG